MADVPGSTLASSSTSAGLGESEPLLQSGRPIKKPFLRARPLCFHCDSRLVPFAIIASVVRSITFAPRVEVYTQLACASVHNHHAQQTVNQTLNLLLPFSTHLPTEHPTDYVNVDPIFIHSSVLSGDDSSSEDDPRKLPSPQCVSDPAVQKEAARIQTVLTITEGLFSALTTGWWGHFSERHGRTRVLALATLGLFLTDLTFILVATPGSILAAHHHKLLVVAPLIEGLLGGWSTLHAATSAYLSDCTSPGSRATIFSRFNGVIYLGFALGPILGGWVINNGIPGIDRIGTVTKEGMSVTEVFWLAICFSFVNFFLTTFLFPESLSKEQRAKARAAHKADSKGKSRSTNDTAGDVSGRRGHLPTNDNFIQRFFSPVALLLPVMINETTNAGIRKRKDWSLTLLGLAVFLHTLSTGIDGIKPLYAVHVYNWAAHQLSYFISYLGAMKAVAALLILPAIISSFKPKPPVSPAQVAAQRAGKKFKPKPTKARLAVEIKFDLLLTKCCIAIDMLSQLLMALVPSPGSVQHMGMASLRQWIQDPNMRNMALFVFANGFGTLSSGFYPAGQSLALCIIQARQLMEESVPGDGNVPDPEQGASAGKLFGALSIVQAVGHMILGPLLFGLVYGNTVAYLPKAIFVVGSGILAVCLLCAFLIRNPVGGHLESRKGKGARRTSDGRESKRGRSRASKDLFGHGASYQEVNSSVMEA
ncbi:hypothetical protein GYMLUDRAFT_57781 [Collybiopsis luxurians FD-317 M1]|uniref:MFS general substrate transporter n=1 Tax=Collybiopsis luxurians FD-317 M1 TaxID=944289 RepID=A0A0D0D1K7_9AGAR|nr:hypothetical protein GYMLUDRAFT_57781 [Collybiopsis luxurians FD-317 M1]